MQFNEVKHPLIQHKLGVLRDITTEVSRFRQVLREITGLLTYEATRYLETEKVIAGGWAGPVKIDRVSGSRVAVAPILRAGLGMLQGVLDLIPSARVNLIGSYRDPETVQTVVYYHKFCPDLDRQTALILDPLLATGGSVLAAVELLKEAGCRRIEALCIVAAPEGVNALRDAHPEVGIWGAALDEGLDENSFILPGLGDAGDRLFGTK